MPILSTHVVVSKTSLLTASLVVGSGTVYLIYQLYTISRQLKRLNCQLTILSEKVFRAQADIKKLHRQLEYSTGVSSNDEGEDEFVDASEERDVSSVTTDATYMTATTASKLYCNGSGDSSLHDDSLISKSHQDHSETAPCLSPSLDEILGKIDVMTKKGTQDDLTGSYTQLKDLIKMHPQEDRIYWRISEVAYLLAQRNMLPSHNVEETHRSLMEEAQQAAHTAVKLDPQSGDAHRWMAIILGSVTQYLPVQEQIKSAYVIKDHIESAIRYKPNDALVYHMMGRWCYSVYMLSWVERKVASALFATPPTATLQDAVSNFEKAEKLDPLSSVANILYLAKCCIAQREYKRAAKYLKLGESMKCQLTDDYEAQGKLQALLKQYRSYDS